MYALPGARFWLWPALPISPPIPNLGMKIFGDESNPTPLPFCKMSLGFQVRSRVKNVVFSGKDSEKILTRHRCCIVEILNSGDAVSPPSLSLPLPTPSDDDRPLHPPPVICHPRRHRFVAFVAIAVMYLSAHRQLLTRSSRGVGRGEG